MSEAKPTNSPGQMSDGGRHRPSQAVLLTSTSPRLEVELATEWKVNRTFRKLHTKKQVQHFFGCMDVSTRSRPHIVKKVLAAAFRPSRR